MQDSGGSPPRALNIVALGPELLRKGVVIPSFAQWAVTGDDNLRIITIGSVAGASLQVTGRFLDAASGQVLPINFVVPVASTRTVTVQDVALGTGYLLNLIAYATPSGAAHQGEVFARLQMVHGLTGAELAIGELLAGYVTNTTVLGWPGSAIEDSLSGPGALKNIIGTTPAAGAEFSITVPTGARWQLISFNARWTPGSAHPAITPQLYASVPNVNLFFVPQTANVVSPNTLFVYWMTGEGYQPGQISNRAAAGLPTDLPLSAGTTISTLTDGLFAADQIDLVGFTVREWLEVI